MSLNILLWFLLGIIASVLVNLVLYDRLVINPSRVIASVVGALVGALALLLAAPEAQGWTMITALMGSITGLAVVWMLEHGQNQAEPW